MIDKPEVQSQRKTSTTFILEGELAKLNIPIPLFKLMRKNSHRSQVIKALRIEPKIGTKALNIESEMHSDTVNITDDQPSCCSAMKLMEKLLMVLFPLSISV
jgi:hypothetical protein